MVSSLLCYKLLLKPDNQATLPLNSKNNLKYKFCFWEPPGKLPPLNLNKQEVDWKRPNIIFSNSITTKHSDHRARKMHKVLRYKDLIQRTGIYTVYRCRSSITRNIFPSFSVVKIKSQLNDCNCKIKFKH